MENPAPKVIDALTLSPEFLKQRVQEEQIQASDPLDNYEIFDIIRHIRDPEHPLSLEQL